MSVAGVGFERIVDPPSESRVVWFRGRQTIYLGSGEDADIRIADDRQVGPSHLQFDLDPPDCRMAVLAGRTLPRVNGRPTRQAVLNGGDVVQVGAVPCGYTSKFSLLHKRIATHRKAPSKAIPGRLPRSSVKTPPTGHPPRPRSGYRRRRTSPGDAHLESSH